jgi:small-conductance mechanosensitive channel
MNEKMLAQIQPVISLFGDSPWLKAGVIILLSMFAALLAKWLVRRGIRRLTSKTRTSFDDQIISLLHRPVFWTVMLLGLQLAAQVGGFSKSLLDISSASISSILILLWMVFAIRASRILVLVMSNRSSDSSLIRPQTMPLFTNLAAVIIIALAVYFMFYSWNIDMTAWLASAGIAGIAIGFAAKDTLANLFSGVFILADSPYKLGDYVVLDNSERGKITHIGIRSTRMLTRDDVEVTVPNSIMGNSKIINESGGPHKKFRIRVSVGVAYGSDIDQVESILMRIARDEEEVCQDPEPRVRFRAFGGSSLDFELLCWVEDPELRGRVLHVLNTAVYKAFNQEGVEIPYAKQDVYIKEMPKST